MTTIMHVQLYIYTILYMYDYNHTYIHVHVHTVHMTTIIHTCTCIYMYITILPCFGTTGETPPPLYPLNFNRACIIELARFPPPPLVNTGEGLLSFCNREKCSSITIGTNVSFQLKAGDK